MVERSWLFDGFCHLLLIGAILLLGFPLYYAFVAATLSPADALKVPLPLIPGPFLLDNMAQAFEQAHIGRLLLNSGIMALGLTILKIALSFLSAYAVTYFRFPFRSVAFWAIFATLMLPIEVRIVPTYAIAANVLEPFQAVLSLIGFEDTGPFGVFMEVRWSLLDSYMGLILPLVASATGTFLFRQFFLTIPEDLLEAARIDGAGPMRFMVDMLLPMSRNNIIALAVILFVYGWNQYLWPLLITTDESMTTAVVGMSKLMPGASEAAPQWHLSMAAAILIMLPPVGVVLLLQRWLVKGIVDVEK